MSAYRLYALLCILSIIQRGYEGIAPGYSSELARALHVGLMFALGCTAFTVVNVPYSSEERFGEIKQIIAGKK